MTIEDEVRNTLHVRADLVGSADVVWERIEEQAVAHGNGARERIVAAVVATAVAIAGIGVVFVALRPTPGPPTRDSSGPVLREIQLGAGPGRIATGFGSVWVAMPDRVVRLDPDTGQIQAEIKVRGITPAGADVAFSQYGGGTIAAPASRRRAVTCGSLPSLGSWVLTPPRTKSSGRLPSHPASRTSRPLGRRCS